MNYSELKTKVIETNQKEELLDLFLELQEERSALHLDLACDEASFEEHISRKFVNMRDCPLEYGIRGRPTERYLHSMIYASGDTTHQKNSIENKRFELERLENLVYVVKYKLERTK